LFRVIRGGKTGQPHLFEPDPILTSWKRIRSGWPAN